MTTKLSPIERDILKKLSLKELKFFSDIAHNKDFETFIKITNVLVDYEKNNVFKMDDADPTLGIKKAYARGMAGGYVQMGRLIMSASEEIERREEELEKKKNGQTNS